MKYIAPHGWFLLAFSISSLALGPVVKHAIDLKYAHDIQKEENHQHSKTITRRADGLFSTDVRARLSDTIQLRNLLPGNDWSPVRRQGVVQPPAPILAGLRPSVPGAVHLGSNFQTKQGLNDMSAGLPVSQNAKPPSPRGQGVTMELSVYDKSYHGGTTKYGRRYDHYKGFTCASNNPTHKLKTLRVTWKGKTLDVLCTDTGGDKKLGYSRLDLSGAAMKFFVPKWHGRDKGAPLLKGAKVEVVK